MIREAQSKERGGSPGYEIRDADAKKIILNGIGLMGLLVFGLVISWIVYLSVSGENPQRGTKVETFVVEQPLGTDLTTVHLEPDPRSNLLALRAGEDSVLLTYGWVNKREGIARIPIDVAMEVVVKRGLPMRGTSQ